MIGVVFGALATADPASGDRRPLRHDQRSLDRWPQRDKRRALRHVLLLRRRSRRQSAFGWPEPCQQPDFDRDNPTGGEFLKRPIRCCSRQWALSVPTAPGAGESSRWFRCRSTTSSCFRPAAPMSLCSASVAGYAPFGVAWRRPGVRSTRFTCVRQRTHGPQQRAHGVQDHWRPKLKQRPAREARDAGRGRLG
jgi:hypothetical protein